MIRTTLLCATAAAFATAAFAPVEAQACGGFFCDGSGPTQVNQAAERIIFAEHPDGQVTAVVQILYEGPADAFGWLLPVPGIPEIGLSSDAAFTALQTATNPRYTMNTTVEGECKEDDRQFGSPTSANNDDGGNFSPNNVTPNNNVMVVDRGNVGPYNYVVLEVSGAIEDRAAIALDWLETNNYQVTSVGPDLIAPYLEEGYNLLAIRLQKSAESGSVRPLKLTYDTDHPMIPIKLTAVAANEDMGVMTWLLGEHRAVPVNYKALEINDALLNWFSPISNYNDVIIAAANEASGQGFVTEYADETQLLGRVVYTENDEALWAGLTNTDWTGRALDLMEAALSNYSWNRFDSNFNQAPWDGITDAFDAALPNITDEERASLFNCGPYCAFPEGAPESFDTATFLTALEDFVDAPMRETQELMDAFPYITRMYTTLSAHEMTLDPSFDYNPDLPTQTNIHTAERIIECHPSVFQWEAPWRAELPSGLVVRGTGTTWPIVADAMMPATLTVTEMGTSGSGEVVRDNFETVRQQLDTANAEIPTPGDVGTKNVGGGAKGCATASGDAAGLAGLLLFGLVGLRRRKPF